MAVLCAVTGLVCLRYLPETVNQPTPETMNSMVVKYSDKKKDEPINVVIIKNANIDENPDKNAVI